MLEEKILIVVSHPDDEFLCVDQLQNMLKKVVRLLVTLHMKDLQQCDNKDIAKC